MRRSYAKNLEPGDVIAQEPILPGVVLYVTPRLAYAGDDVLKIVYVDLSGEIMVLKRHKTESVDILLRGVP